MELLDEYEFHTFLMFPEECVKTENDGTLYIWTVSRTNEYPEEAFKANKRVIQITQETDDMVYVSFQFIPSGEAIVRNWTGQIADGGRVVVADDSKNHEVYRSLQLSQYENTACTEVCRRYFLWLILFPEDIFEL